MLYKVNDIKGFKLNGRDGEIGTVREFYFDDQYWTLRYLVADTGTWLTDRKVLITPYSLLSINSAERNILVDLTKKQIENSPSLETDMPVSRQFEETYYGYYGLPMYWAGPYMWGSDSFIIRDEEKRSKQNINHTPWDPHLRSTHDVVGHNIQASDGEIGHVADFVIDDESWAIRYLIVDTKNWLLGKKVLIAPKWIERISWEESKVYINLLRETILHSPEYNAEDLLTRDYEADLHKHYNRKGYWTDETFKKLVQ